eukprot:959424_1
MVYVELSVYKGYGSYDTHRAYNVNMHYQRTISFMISQYRMNELGELQTRISVDNVSYYLHSLTVHDGDTVSSQQHYSLCLNTPWYNGMNGTVTNVCIKSLSISKIPSPSSVCEAEIKCNETLGGILYRGFGIDYYYFNVSDDLPFVMFDLCGSLYDTNLQFNDVDLYLYDTDFTVLHHGADTGVCFNKEQLLITHLDAGQYVLGIGYTVYVPPAFYMGIKCDL